MRKHRVLILLAVAAVVCFAPAETVAESAPAVQKRVQVNSEAHQKYTQKKTVQADGEGDSQADNEAWLNQAVDFPLPTAQEGDSFFYAPLSDDAGVVPAVSEFVLEGDALVKYQGSASFVSVPEGVRVIRGGAFAGNRAVAAVYLPDSVEEIEGGAFENCAMLQTVSISANSRLSVIGAKAFAGCPLLNGSFASDVGNVASDAFYQAPKQQETETTVKNKETAKSQVKENDRPAAPVKPSADVSRSQPASAAGSLKIVRQPESVAAERGDYVAFIVVAEGSGEISYQWLQSKDGVSWSKIRPGSAAFENAATNVLSFVVSRAISGRRFKCVITDGVNTVESNVVRVVTEQGPDDDPLLPDPFLDAPEEDELPPENQDGGEEDAPPEPEEDETVSIGKEIEADDLVFMVTPEGAVVTAYHGEAASLTVPAKIQDGNKEYIVIGIGPHVFSGNQTLTSIKLPDTVLYIETAAFAYCSAMIDK